MILRFLAEIICKSLDFRHFDPQRRPKTCKSLDFRHPANQLPGYGLSGWLDHSGQFSSRSGVKCNCPLVLLPQAWNTVAMLMQLICYLE